MSLLKFWSHATQLGAWLPLRFYPLLRCSHFNKAPLLPHKLAKHREQGFSFFSALLISQIPASGLADPLLSSSYQSIDRKDLTFSGGPCVQPSQVYCISLRLCLSVDFPPRMSFRERRHPNTLLSLMLVVQSRPTLCNPVEHARLPCPPLFPGVCSTS